MGEINQNIEKTQGLDNKSESKVLNIDDLLKEIEDKLSNKDLSYLAKEELEEFKAKLKEIQELYKKEKQDIIQTGKVKKQDIIEDLDSSYIKQDLLDEFQDDLKALDIIEEKFKNYRGYNEFISLLKSNNLSEQEKEDIYTLFLSNDKRFIRNLRRKLPENKIELDKLLENGVNNIENKKEKELQEILALQDDLENMSLKKLIYIREKLIDLGEQTKDLKKKRIINKIIVDINILLEIKQEKEKIKQEKEKIKQEKEKIKQEKENVKNKVEDILENIKTQIPELLNKEFIKQDNKLSNLLLQLNDKSLNIKKQKEISKQIANYLKKPGVLSNLLKLAKESGSEDYKQFYSFAVNIANISGDNGLKQILANYPSNIDYTDLPKGDSKRFELEQYFSGDTSKVIVDGEKYYLNDEVVDYSKEPPLHFIFNKDTLYKLKVEDNQSAEIQQKATQMKEIYNKMYNTKKEELKIKNENKKLSNLLKDENKLGEIAKTQGKDIQTIKSEIKNKIEINNKKIIELKGVYKKLKDKYIYLSEDDEFEEGKAEKRKILKFLHNTCFDVIPQNFTDKLIAEIKLNSLIIPGFKINPQRIDITNGNFGEAESEDNPTKWQENLIDFLNKMIYGEINPKESIIKKSFLIGPFAGNIDPEDFKSLLQKQGIMSKSGLYFNIEKARSNLSKVGESV